MPLRRSTTAPILVTLAAIALAWAGGFVGQRIGEGERAVVRPQEPVGALPYETREVVLDRGEIVLTGTVSLPRGPGLFPGVVLVSGAGAQDRDGTLMGHKRYLVLADHLTRAGIAVLRYDDRGTGGSGGDLLLAGFEDLAGDALTAAAELARQPEVDASRVGFVGASEGSLVSTLAAVAPPEDLAEELKVPIAFLVLLSAPALPGEDVLVDQQLALARAAGADEATLVELEALVQEAMRVRTWRTSEAVRREELQRIVFEIERLEIGGPELELPFSDQEDRRRRLADVMLSPSMRDLLNHDPRPVLGQVAVPLLALYGAHDLQVEPALHSRILREALEAAPTDDVDVRILPGLNHLLQPSATGLPSEYGKIEVALAPWVLETISTWILERFRQPRAEPLEGEGAP